MVCLLQLRHMSVAVLIGLRATLAAATLPFLLRKEKRGTLD